MINWLDKLSKSCFTPSMIPTIVKDWVAQHKGNRSATHSPGHFYVYVDSKTSASWGQPVGGTRVGDYLVAVFQPSPQRVGDKAFMYWDYVKA